MFRAAILFIFLAIPMASEGSHWKYGETEYFRFFHAGFTIKKDEVTSSWDKSGYGPDEWKEVSEHCAESAQSPINIETCSTQQNPGLNGLSFVCDSKTGKVKGNLTNNGHAPTLSIDKPSGTAKLTGGPLGMSVYKLQQLHFHFGCDDNKGSEHTVDYNAYSGELHLVTYNTKYPDFDTAKDKPDGLSVIGVFLTAERPGVNLELNKLSSKIRQIRYSGMAVQVEELFLYNLVPDLRYLSRAHFYSYKGSLTTPPCYQSVSWIVLKQPIYASNYALESMRYLRNAEGLPMCNNFRPTQPLNGRTVSEY